MRVPVRFVIMVASAFVAAACADRDRIWNAADLEKWVRSEAESQGFRAESIRLEEWYVKDGGRNVWRGEGIDAATGAKRSFAIPVDRVWTPSSEP